MAWEIVQLHFSGRHESITSLSQGEVKYSKGKMRFRGQAEPMFSKARASARARKALLKFK